MDIALELAGDGSLVADWAVAGGDIRQDQGLRTAVAISLLTDRTAAPDDDLPDGTGDRRGWWGDMPLPGAAPDPIGSRLWLLARAKRTAETLTRAEGYAAEALAWLVEDGVAAAVDVAASWGGAAGDQLRLVVTIRRRDGSGQPDARFDFAWEATNG